jgi:hypothetical protein
MQSIYNKNRNIDNQWIEVPKFVVDKWMDKILRASIHDCASLPMCLFVHETIDLDPCNI